MKKGIDYRKVMEIATGLRDTTATKTSVVKNFESLKKDHGVEMATAVIIDWICGWGHGYVQEDTEAVYVDINSRAFLLYKKKGGVPVKYRVILKREDRYPGDEDECHKVLATGKYLKVYPFFLKGCNRGYTEIHTNSFYTAKHYHGGGGPIIQKRGESFKKALSRIERRRTQRIRRDLKTIGYTYLGGN